MKKSNKIMIVGAGGHGKVCAEIAEQYYEEVNFLDDNLHSISVGKVSDYIHFLDNDFFIAIGDNLIREKITKHLTTVNIVSLIDKSAIVSKTAKIGNGTVVMANAVINADAIIEEGCIINTSSSVDHECIINSFSHISVGSHLAGKVRVGKRFFGGAGSIVINNIRICDDVTLGAGCVCVKNINVSGIYIGVPARLK